MLTSQFSDNADYLAVVLELFCTDFMRNIVALVIQVLIPVRSCSTELKFGFVSSVDYY